MDDAKSESVAPPWENPPRQARDGGSYSTPDRGNPMTGTPSRSDLSVSRLRDQIQREISNLSLSSQRVNAAVVEIESVLVSMKDRLRAQTRQAEDLKQALATIERLA